MHFIKTIYVTRIDKKKTACIFNKYKGEKWRF